MTIDLAPDIEERVRKLAADFHVSEDFLVRSAVEQFIEDREDYAAGIQALSSIKHSISLDEMERLSDAAD
jgi:predicted DNA-binding protein